MGVWQIVWIGIMAISLGANLVMRGKPKQGKYNFFVALLGLAIELIPLILGGFFTT